MDEEALSRIALGTIVTVWRQRVRRITQRQLEEAAGLPNGSVSRFERGDGLPSPDALRSIAEVLDVSPNDLRWAAAGLLDHLARGLGSAGPVAGGDPLGDLASSEVASGPVPIPSRLEHRWRRLRVEEAAVRRERDLLELETMLWISRAAASESYG